MGGLFLYTFKWNFHKMLLCLSLAVLTFGLGAGSTRAAEAGIGAGGPGIHAADLAIVKSVTPDVAAPGQPVTYTLAFTNTGDELAAGVVITDVIPSELTAVSYQASPGLIITDTGYLPSYVWQVQDLAPDVGGVITVTGILSPALIHTAAFTNTATIATIITDTNPADNASLVKILVGYPLADTPWPHHRRDLAQTGRSPYVGPTHPMVNWAFPVGENNWLGSPTIGMDGTIYVGSADYKLFAVNPDGSLKWIYPINDRYILGAPAIAADGTVYFGTTGGGLLYALKPDGSLKWWFYTFLSSIFSSPTIGTDGVIYFASFESLFAVNPDGTQRWVYPGLGGHSSPAIGPDGTIYIGNDKLYAIRPDGSLEWAYTTAGYISSSPAIGADGTIYVGSEDHNLYAIDPDGNLVWAYTAGAEIVLSSAAIGSDGSIYIASSDGFVHAVNPSGTPKWIFFTGYPFLTSSPVIDANGTVYVQSIENGLYALNPDGTQKWVIPAGGSTWDSSPAIGADKTIYLGGWDNKLYAIGEAIVDLQITKSVTPDVAAPGQPVTYTLAFTNTGEDLAAGVVITDVIPSELTAVSYQASPGLIITDTGHLPSYVWQVQDLASGQGGVITVTGVLTVGLRGGWVITNTAAITTTTASVDVIHPTSLVTMTVLQVPPELAFIPDRTVDETITLTFTVTAMDLNGDALAFSLASGPAGASLAPAGAFTWTPDESQGPGVYTATLQVVDNGIPPLSDSQTFTITVTEVNVTPMVTVGPNAILNEGSALSRGGSFSDPDNGQAWNATVDYGDGSGVQALALAPDRTFTLDHAYGDDGVYTLTVTVSDEVASGQDSLQVTALNIAPTLGAFSDQVVAAGQPITVTGIFTDPAWLDTHSVAIAWSAGVTQTIELAAGETTFSAGHVYANPGEYIVSITVTDDDGGQSSQAFTVTVLPLYQRVYLPMIRR